MTDINEILNQRSDGRYQILVSVPQEQAQEVADALDSLLQKFYRSSKSAIVVNAILEYANKVRSEE